MASVAPRAPYSPDELRALYPPALRLELVQLVLRHGERTPVSARFQNAGLAPHWPYCGAARRFRDVVLASQAREGGAWDALEYRRRVETLGARDGPVLARAVDGGADAVCHPGELTDKGRETTLALGSRLRKLYVDQLRFLPEQLSDPASTIMLRSTPIVRAQQSVEQAFVGLYPRSARSPDCPAPTIISRTMTEETLFPNTGACRRFRELFDQFAERAARRWNDSEELDYINKKIGKWMPDEHKRIKVDGKPRLSGIMDTTNASLAHLNAAKTRLPTEFYDEQLRAKVDRVVCDEWYTGYGVSREYRMLGMGSVINDMTSRMIWHIEGRDAEGAGAVGRAGSDVQGRPKIWLAGAHDTTLAGLLASLGAFGDSPWPPFTSHVAIELFSRAPEHEQSAKSGGWLSSLLGGAGVFVPARSLATKATATYTEPERELLRKHYVRIRYNDVPVVVPGCAKEGRHLEGDATFCTLEAFKKIVEAFAPTDWRAQCRENLGAALAEHGGSVEPAGWPQGESGAER